jgi:hypothetical protein
VFSGSAFIRLHPAPRPHDPPEASPVDAFAAGSGGQDG